MCNLNLLILETNATYYNYGEKKKDNKYQIPSLRPVKAQVPSFRPVKAQFL